MMSLIEQLKTLIARGFGGQTTRERCPVNIDASTAPASIQSLVEAMATSVYKVDLGEFIMRPPASVATMAAEIESACEGAEVDAPPVDPAATLLLTADRGGQRALGLGWADGKVFGLVVELADPMPETVAQRYDTPAALLAALDDINRRRGKVADVDALRSASS